MGWMNDFTNYMRCDPYFRKNNYGELTFSMLYAYSEDFVLVFSHDEVVHGKGSMMGKMPGETLEAKAENLRAAYGFMMSHPGKKLLFMGQDYGQIDEWNENASLEWDLLKYPLHKNMQTYVRELNKLYQAHPALYEQDFDTEGFEWINCSYHEESMIMFVRRGKKKCFFAYVILTMWIMRNSALVYLLQENIKRSSTVIRKNSAVKDVPTAA